MTYVFRMIIHNLQNFVRRFFLYLFKLIHILLRKNENTFNWKRLIILCKLQDRKGLREAVEHAQEESFENQVLVEEYVTGTEYSVEYISYQGEHHFLAMTLKRTTGAPYFIETGHLEPAPVDEKILNNVKKVITIFTKS